MLRAAEEQKPILLSVGYSSCHWCHVMAHESFEDPEVARALNDRFISIKVDREERPDLDEAYMMAVQLATRRGGWPMTLFLTPQKDPFFAGTYFPKEDHGQYPGFLTLVKSVAHAWATRRSEIQQSARDFAKELREVLAGSSQAEPGPISWEMADNAIQALHADFDHEWGGFGSAPKFPPHSALLFMARYASQRDGRSELQQELCQQAADMTLQTLRAIALGGIHDHVGGGFHRYSTDERWLLPHFEKMLYDNAQLLEAYVAGKKLAESKMRFEHASLFARAARGIVRWLKAEMTAPDGTFYSALDADSEGEEGKFYVWQEQEIIAAIGPEGPSLASAFGVRAKGNFLDEATHLLTGQNVLHLTADQEDRFQQSLAILKHERARRARPMTDDKSLASWNGMAMHALAQAGETDMAEQCAGTWLEAYAREGELPHQLFGGRPAGEPYLDDLAQLARACFTLHEATEKEQYRTAAEQMTRQIQQRFSASDGGFYFTSDQHEQLFGRTKQMVDHQTPSANAVAAECLLLAGDPDGARQAVEAAAQWMEKLPTGSCAVLELSMRLLR